MSVSVSGSHHRVASQLLKGLREAGGTTTAASGTTGAASTASGTSIDSTGNATSSAMMTFLARLSGSSDGGSGLDGTSAADAPPPPPGPPPGTDAAGTAAAASTSGTISASTLIGALETVLQSMTASAGTNGSTSLSTGDLPPPPPPSSVDGSATTGTAGMTSTSTDGQIQAFMQALQAYAAQSSSATDA